MGANGMKSAWLENGRKAALCCPYALEAAIPSLAERFVKRSGIR